MRIVRSFRGRLALRFGATVLVVAFMGSAIGYLVLREILYAQLDTSLETLAEIEAAATADTRDESVHFHDEIFVTATDREASLTRYAQVWNVNGEPVLRTRNLEGRDLPLPDGTLDRVLATERPELFGFEWEGRRYRGLLYPLGLVGPQHEAHLLQVAAPTEHVETVLARFLRMLGALVLAGTLAASILGWWLAGHAVRPVMQIIGQAESVDMKGGEHRITADAETEELSRLVSVLNSMLARIDTAFETQRRFLADAGHEIKTPLTILRGDVEVTLRRNRSPGEYEAVLRQALEDLKEVSALAEDLITLARSDSGSLEPRPGDVPIERLLERVADRYARVAEDAGVRLGVEPGDPLSVNGDAALLERALSNLVDNAIKYGRDGGRLDLSATAEDGLVRITVSDDGPGIPTQERSRLFERFFRGETGRRSARGSGLGLSIVKAIVEAHGGRVELVSEVAQGTTVSVLLPTDTTLPRPAVSGESFQSALHLGDPL